MEKSVRQAIVAVSFTAVGLLNSGCMSSYGGSGRIRAYQPNMSQRHLNQERHNLGHHQDYERNSLRHHQRHELHNNGWSPRLQRHQTHERQHIRHHQRHEQGSLRNHQRH